jgi:hypothetical protein
MAHDGPTKMMTLPDIKRDFEIRIRPTTNPNMAAQIDTSLSLTDTRSVLPGRHIAVVTASEAHRSMLGALPLPHGRFYQGRYGRSRFVLPGCPYSWPMPADSSFPDAKRRLMDGDQYSAEHSAPSTNERRSNLMYKTDCRHDRLPRRQASAVVSRVVGGPGN